MMFIPMMIIMMLVIVLTMMIIHMMMIIHIMMIINAHPHYDDQDARTMRVRGPPSRPGGWDPHRERGEESVLRITPRLMNLFKGPK